MTTQEHEICALVYNADETVLGLNDQLGDAEFVKVPLPELERSYSGMFPLPAQFKATAKVAFSDGGTNTMEFLTALTVHVTNGFDIVQRGYAILLRWKRKEVWTVDERGTIHPTFVEMGQFQKSVSKIIQCLRLSAAGDVEAPRLYWLVLPEKKTAGMGGWGSTRRQGRTLSVKKEDIDRFRSIYAHDLSDQWPFALAHPLLRQRTGLRIVEVDLSCL